MFMATWTDRTRNSPNWKHTEESLTAIETTDLGPELRLALTSARTATVAGQAGVATHSWQFLVGGSTDDRH
jgi:hypothetical protein